MTTSLDDLEQLRTVEQAEVYKGGLRAATLSRTDQGIEFRYADAGGRMVESAALGSPYSPASWIEVLHDAG